MKTREQIYSREATEILRDITTYHYIRHDQLLRLYPQKNKDVIDNLLSYLVRQGRIFYDSNRDWYHDGTEAHVDTEMLAALWVLADFIDRTVYHSATYFPIKLFFFAEGEVYEVIYVAIDKEALIEQALLQSGEENGKRILIIEDTAQIERLHISDIAAYCIVSDMGEIQYYKQQNKEESFE